MLDSSEALLLAFAQHRREGVFRALYDISTPRMLGLALRLSGGDRAIAEDIVQDAWMRAVDRIDRYRAPASVSAWLNGFVANCWRERVRTVRDEVALPPEWDGARDDASLWSEAPLLERAVNALPDGYRTVLVLHDIEGFTHREIADQLGIEEGTSKSQLTRARRHLRASLGAASGRTGRTKESQ